MTIHEYFHLEPLEESASDALRLLMFFLVQSHRQSLVVWDHSIDASKGSTTSMLFKNEKAKLLAAVVIAEEMASEVALVAFMTMYAQSIREPQDDILFVDLYGRRPCQFHRSGEEFGRFQLQNSLRDRTNII